ncbi:MAG: TRAP transporter small permease [Deltaproteobacteria bacterium]|nr:TRAP transporter small permease [Deltaproteobacteria bacterium]MBW2150336.1 TRAP transporter small permease [Deltaproteobacteria bacterium]
MKKLYGFASNLFESLSTIFLACILTTVILQVFFRYVARIVVPWTEEFARYLCIWMVFMGAAAAVAKETHIRITFVLDRMPEKIRLAFEVLSLVIVFLFNLILFLGSIDLIRLNWGQQAVTFPVSVAVLYLAIAVSSFFILVFLLVLCFNRLARFF